MAMLKPRDHVVDRVVRGMEHVRHACAKEVRVAALTERATEDGPRGAREHVERRVRGAVGACDWGERAPRDETLQHGGDRRHARVARIGRCDQQWLEPRLDPRRAQPAHGLVLALRVGKPAEHGRHDAVVAGGTFLLVSTVPPSVLVGALVAGGGQCAP